MEGQKNSSLKTDNKKDRKGIKKQCFVRRWCTFGKKNGGSKTETKSATKSTSSQSEKSQAVTEAKPVAIKGNPDVKLPAPAKNDDKGKKVHFSDDAKPLTITSDLDVKLEELAMNDDVGKELLGEYQGALYYFNDENTEGCSVM